ncbi:MAG: GIY-YIG nuclease family protein [bacterium]|nr:GIY-YIG nuclease family protein [bacterium]
MAYTVYILRTSKNTLYIGQTNNLDKRLADHAAKNQHSAKYLKYFDSFQLEYSETQPTLSAALKRERELKSWSKDKKEKLIKAAAQVL